ncbi:MAG: glucosamine-6-phosphate deaminase [Clostridiaceae bacterium]|nr:glucosamine-6-phosphate deaminase [Clostridiaceae bacterium]
MKLIIKKDYDELSKIAAEIILAEINKKPDMVLGLATGSTPIGTYKKLIDFYNEGKVDFSKVATFNLDEYYGLLPQDSQSYHYFMHKNLFSHINIKPENIHIPNGQAKDADEYVKEYDKTIENAGGIDLQILGIGANGHIAFNEPADELFVGTHLTGLTQSTIEANSRFFNSIDEVPKKAITMGIGSIIKAKKILLLANGKSKAKIIAQLLNNDTITTRIPASVLLLHNDTTLIIDKEASEGCENQ